MTRAMVVLLLVVGTRAGAQAGSQVSPLSSRLDPATVMVVEQLIDSATKAKLPGNLLRDRALEVQARGAPAAVIVAAVRTMTNNLGAARTALGAKATPDELRWGATAIDAGMPVRGLVRIRAATGRSVATALLVSCDLLAKGVESGPTTDLVTSMLRAGVRDAGLLLFQQEVKADIRSGASSAVAAAARAKGAIDKAAKRL
jgi:hypothetical protein